MIQNLYQEKNNVRGNIMPKPGPAKGSRKSSAHKKKIGKSLIGKKNPKYKDGRRSYRRIAGAKSGDVVDHKDGNRLNNKRSNLRVLKGKKPGTNTTTSHEKKTKRGQGRKPGSKNKLSINVRDFKLFGTKRR